MPPASFFFPATRLAFPSGLPGYGSLIFYPVSEFFPADLQLVGCVTVDVYPATGKLSAARLQYLRRLKYVFPASVFAPVTARVGATACDAQLTFSRLPFFSRLSGYNLRSSRVGTTTNVLRGLGKDRLSLRQRRLGNISRLPGYRRFAFSRLQIFSRLPG